MVATDASTILACMKNPEDQRIRVLQFVANLVVSHYYLANLAGREFRQSHTKARVGRNPRGARYQQANGSGCGDRIDGGEKLVKTYEVGVRL
jgi:hypothetical protein